MSKPRSQNRGRVLIDAMSIVLAAGETRGPLSVSEVQARLECSRRTAYRWLRAWRSLGFPVAVQDRDRRSPEEVRKASA